MNVSATEKFLSIVRPQRRGRSRNIGRNQLVALFVTLTTCVHGAFAFATDAPVVVHEVPNANGWVVKASFRNDPTAFARAAHVWTLAKAKEVARQLTLKYADHQDLSVAEIRVEGAEGNGDIADSMAPHLPDWPLVDREFRVRTDQRLERAEDLLAEVAESYKSAAAMTESVLESREPLATRKHEALAALYDKYNSLADRLDDTFFNKRPQPLPRLRLPEPELLLAHARDWANAKRLQYRLEQIAQPGTRSDLSEFREATVNDVALNSPQRTDSVGRVVFDDEVSKGDSKNDDRLKVLGINAKDLYGLEQSVDKRLNSLVNSLVDNSRVAPPPSQFSTAEGGAVYRSVPAIQIRMTDANGNDMPDSRQPTGYPKPFDPQAKLNIGEKVFVDPSLRVELLPGKPENQAGEVRSGVYGKVTRIEPEKNRLSLQVDAKGTQVVMIGVTPRDLAVGDYVTPTRVVGTLNRTRRDRGNWDFVIRALNANNRLLAPGPVVDLASRPPQNEGELDQELPGADALELPVEQSNDLDSTMNQARVEFDDSAEKGANLRDGNSDLERQIAEQELRFAQARENAARQELATAESELRQAEQELTTVEAEMKSIEETLLADITPKADDLQRRKNSLDQEDAKLLATKRQLEQQRANARTNAAIDAYNRLAAAHNARHQKQSQVGQAYNKDADALRAKLQVLEQKYRSLESRQSQLKQRQQRLQSQVDEAKGRLEQATSEIQTRQQALQTSVDELTSDQNAFDSLSIFDTPTDAR